MTEMQVALYARVSSDQQAEAGTIASQLADLEARLTADGYADAPVLRFIDEGYSGATLLRPALAIARCSGGGRDRSALCPLPRSARTQRRAPSRALRRTPARRD